MTYLLDTDTCIYWLRDTPAVRERVRNIAFTDLALSVISVAELYFGAYNSARPPENLARVEVLLGQIAIWPLTLPVLKQFGQIKTALRQQGQPVADFDLLIASTALVESRILVTSNLRHYARIPGLRLENWHPGP